MVFDNLTSLNVKTLDTEVPIIEPRGAPLTPESYLRVIPRNIRGVYYWSILIVSVFALIANVLAVKSILKRKWKFLKKSCLISLAVADVFTVTFFAINSLETLSNELSVWTLGEFMCYLIPMCQVLGTTASSLFLLIVALDRYQNVNLGKSWEPKPLSCLGLVFLIFFVCTMISYPMFTFFDYKEVMLIIPPSQQQPEFAYEPVFMCIVTLKDRLAIYYVIMNIVIFFPILATFVWFYFSIAALIWKHRKPLSAKYDSKPQVEESSTSCSKVTSSTAYSANNNNNVYSILKKGRNVQFEKKIRTFRIVLALMLSFVVCRFPYWCYYTLRLVLVLKGDVVWNVHFFFLILNVANCALDPLLYTFLNETIGALKIVNDFIYKVFCCCLSNDDFEDFEKNNPFEDYNAASKKNSKGSNDKAKFSEETPVDSNARYQRY